MKLKHLSRILVVSIFLLIMVVPSVWGAWLYNFDQAQTDISFKSSIGEFYYASEEILPDVEDPKKKENHLLLVENVLYHARYGINGGDKDVIHSYLDTDGAMIYGNQNVSGGNLKHVLVKNTTAENVQFCMTRISATEYHCYTFGVNELGETPEGEYLLVYKTIMIYGVNPQGVTEWYSLGSAMGYAKACDPGVVSKSIDIKTFTTIKPSTMKT